jgi:hypothetical protein
VHLEAEWLDMLSQLEFVGCRKILKAVPFGKVTLDVLRHLEEEASHAFLLKSLVKPWGMDSRPWTENIFAAAAWEYFKILDDDLSKHGTEASQSYPLVSWAIECRALVVYGLYVQITQSEATRRVLTRILAQERRHESQFGEDSTLEDLKTNARKIEEQLWTTFLNKLTEILNNKANSLPPVPNKDDGRLAADRMYV